MTTAMIETKPKRQDYWDSTPHGRYLRDPAFHQLVDALEHMVHECQYTPSELREAALLASIHYEERRVRSYFVMDNATGKVAEDFDTARML